MSLWTSALIGVGIGAGLALCVWMGATIVWIRVIGQEMIRLNTNLTLLSRDIRK